MRKRKCRRSCIDGIRIVSVVRLIMEEDDTSQVYSQELYEIQACDACGQYDSDKQAADAIQSRLSNYSKTR